MDVSGRGRGGSTQVTSRARAVRWAFSLIAIAAAGFAASAQAAEHTRSAAELSEAVGCAGATRLGYEVQYDEEIGGYGVTGAALEGFPPGCAGRAVVVRLLGPEGETLAVQHLELADGATASFASVDARVVTGLEVRPG